MRSSAELRRAAEAMKRLSQEFASRGENGHGENALAVSRALLWADGEPDGQFQSIVDDVTASIAEERRLHKFM